MDVNTSVDLTGNFAGDLHGVLRAATQQGPLAVDVATGATVVLPVDPDTVIALGGVSPGAVTDGKW
jgi:hypothetical protein